MIRGNCFKCCACDEMCDCGCNSEVQRHVLNEEECGRDILNCQSQFLNKEEVQRIADTKACIQVPLWIVKSGSSSTTLFDHRDIKRSICSGSDLVFQMFRSAFEKLNDGEIELAAEDKVTGRFLAMQPADSQGIEEAEKRKRKYRKVKTSLKQADKFELLKIGLHGKVFWDTPSVKLY